jgi:hypothetical protein
MYAYVQVCHHRPLCRFLLLFRAFLVLQKQDTHLSHQIEHTGLSSTFVDAFVRAEADNLAVSEKCPGATPSPCGMVKFVC